MPKEYVFNFPTLGETEGVKAGSLNFSTAVASALASVEEKYQKQQEDEDNAEKPSAQHDRKDSKDAERSRQHTMYPKEYERRMRERSQHPPPQLDSQSSQVTEQGDAKQ